MKTTMRNGFVLFERTGFFSLLVMHYHMNGKTVVLIKGSFRLISLHFNKKETFSMLTSNVINKVLGGDRNAALLLAFVRYHYSGRDSTRGHGFLWIAPNSNHCPGMLGAIYVDNRLQPHI